MRSIMKLIFVSMMRALAVCALAAIWQAGSFAFAASQSYGGQDKDKGKEKSQVSDAEAKDLNKISAAPDAAAKLQAATEFIKKYPKSTQRAQIAAHLAGEINKVQDPAQRITMLESLLALFKEPGEVNVINPILIDAYIKSEK